LEAKAAAIRAEVEKHEVADSGLSKANQSMGLLDSLSKEIGEVHEEIGRRSAQVNSQLAARGFLVF